MSRHFSVGIIRSTADADLTEHPAVQAWTEAGIGRRSSVHALECLKDSRRKSKVYRLFLSDAARPTAIAKWRPQSDSLDLEVFTQLLPAIGLAAPAVYGEISSPRLGSWLFLEDLGDTRPALLTVGDREKVADWLATLTRAEQFGPLAGRNCGPTYFRALAGSVAQRIRENADNPWIRDDNRTILRQSQRALECLEQRWHQLETVCAVAPMTLVHGDLVQKNIRVRQCDGELIVFDWEKGGMGVPSVDLSSIPCDLVRYVDGVRTFWPAVTVAMIRRLSKAGMLFRSIARLSWETAALAHSWSSELSFERSVRLLNEAVAGLELSESL